MEEIRSLEATSLESLYKSFQEAFSDYEIQLNKEEFSIMLNRRGFASYLSFGLFLNDQLRSFILNGIGKFNGIDTAYDIGTGTIKEFRGRGHISRLFNYGLPLLKKAGISQYLLEVLQYNNKAISVYKNLGFKVSRSFNYYTQQVSLLRIPNKEIPEDYEIREIDFKILNEINLGDFNPSWQNGSESILRSLKEFRFIAVLKGDCIIGYCIFVPISGDISQIAVQKDHRRKGIATVLLREAVKHIKHSSVKVINTEVTCSNITEFLDSFGIPLNGKQFEMIREI